MRKKVGLNAAISLFDFFSIEDPELTLSAISQKSGYPPSSTLRYLKALAAVDLVRRDDSRKTYSLGYKVFRLYEIASNSVNLYKVAMPYMKELRDKFNETVALFVENGNYGVCIGHFISTHTLTHIPVIGAKRPFNVGSRKVFIAYMPESRIQSIISQGLEKTSPETINDPKEFLNVLQDIRQKGYCLSNSKQLGIKSIGLPIWSNNSVIGVLSVTGPSFRISKNESTIFLETLKTSGEIAKKMGGHTPGEGS